MTRTDGAPALSVVTRTQGANQAPTDGSVVPRTAALRFTEVPVLVQAFRSMVRELRYDVCEMALTTYLCAREHGIAFTALPVFLVRGFHHGAIVTAPPRPGRSVVSPAGLAGQRVGVNRGYTVTTGVWARAILAREYGADLDAITWVRSGDEHVAAYRPPPNVVPLPAGASLAGLLGAGELAAAVGAGPDLEGMVPLIPDAAEAGYRALRERGHYPVNHLVVVRDDVLAARPGLDADLFGAFARAKQPYLERLRRGESVTATDLMYERVMRITGEDPLPYGIEPNRAVLAELIENAVAQHILAEAPAIDGLFAAGTRTLAG